MSAVTTGVIIAAGQGNRIRRFDHDVPKPLRRLLGLTLLKRIILSAKKAGLERFVVVVGYKSESIREAVQKDPHLRDCVTFVENEEWDKPNGLSVLSAQQVVKENFVLLMSDHIFEAQALKKLRTQTVADDEAMLCIDRRLETVFDMDDATKVRLGGDRITRIGKELGVYEAVDTGMFLFTPRIFEILEKNIQSERYSLSEAVQAYCDQGKMRTVDIGEAYWQDVDTKEAMRHAEKTLIKSLTKPTDGIISRNFNRKISTSLSRWLVRLPISANVVTFSALVIGLASAYFVAKGDVLSVAIGGLFFQLASIYDGCDGEMARLRMASNRFGEWLDTFVDNVTFMAFLVGCTMGLSHQQAPAYLISMGWLSLVGLGLTLTIMCYYLIRYTRSGSLATIQTDLGIDLDSAEPTFLSKIVPLLKPLAKRDLFALCFCFFALVNRLDLIVVTTFIGSQLAWIILLGMKREFAPTVDIAVPAKE
jgi:1L-myo-inositol 1-phosphate cytidylyltransferase / CDP-L-myo-inositol myo-inositolphosphotransferase